MKKLSVEPRSNSDYEMKSPKGSDAQAMVARGPAHGVDQTHPQEATHRSESIGVPQAPADRFAYRHNPDGPMPKPTHEADPDCNKGLNCSM